MSNDETAILQLHRDFAAAWGGGDAEALVAFFAEDAVRVGAGGDIQHGQAEIRAAFERLFSGPFKGAGLKIEGGTVRQLGKDFALWEGALEIRPGPDRPPVRGHVVDVMKRVDGKWLILETHPKLFPPPPPAAPSR